MASAYVRRLLAAQKRDLLLAKVLGPRCDECGGHDGHEAWCRTAESQPERSIP